MQVGMCAKLLLISALMIGVSSDQDWSHLFHTSESTPIQFQPTTSRPVYTPPITSTRVTGPSVRHDNIPTGCGYRNVDGVESRMSGLPDTEAEFGEFPWMVAINWIESNNPYICGGSLITPNIVLTSAHNLIWKRPYRLKVIAGDWDRSSTIESLAHQERRVSQIILHENFNKNHHYNDIALVILTSPFLLAPHVNTVCLPPANHNFDFSNCFSTGWGKEVFGHGPYRNVLKRIPMPVVENGKCQEKFREYQSDFDLHSSFMCAGGESGQDMCKGDGGSPLVCPIEGTENRFYQAGIVSWGYQCHEKNTAGVYASVPKLRSWIDRTLARKGISSSLYTP